MKFVATYLQYVTSSCEFDSYLSFLSYAKKRVNREPTKNSA